MNIIIITGASSGIGREFAVQLDQHFDNIDEFWLVGRNSERLKQLKETLRHPVRICEMDLTRKECLIRFSLVLKGLQPTVRMLVNCAGVGSMGAFADQELNEQLRMIHLNCEALTEITHRVLPYMTKNSRIIQMASAAAFLPQANFAVYAATKSYVLSFSRALGEELLQRGIYVTCVCPGPVDTPFLEKAARTGSTLALKKYVTVKPEAVVKKALYDSYQKKSVSIYSLPIRAFAAAARVLPHQMLLAGVRTLSRREQGKS